LLILVTTPASEERRQAGETGVDVRLVHQMAKPEGDWPKRQGK
jgi:hypothetical protein